MPLHWKILSKNFLLNIIFFTFFFVSVSIFFKLSRLTKYFVSGIDLMDLSLLLTVFLYRCFPIAISITCFISSYIIVSNIKNNGQIKAFSALGLNPSSLFTPLLFISSMLAMLNLAINLILFPAINTNLRSVLDKKKNQTEILESFTRKFNKDDRYLNLKKTPNKKEGLNFFFIEAHDNLSWLISEKVQENNNTLKFTNPSYFKIAKEDKGFNSIILSENTSLIVPKKSIFSILPCSTLEIDPIDSSMTKLLSTVLFSFYPIVFTILGIILSLRICNIFAISIFILNISMLILSSITLSPIINLLSIFSFFLICPLYSLILYKYNRGV